jgi:hypothetical protein
MNAVMRTSASLAAAAVLPLNAGCSREAIISGHRPRERHEMHQRQRTAALQTHDAAL